MNRPTLSKELLDRYLAVGLSAVRAAEQITMQYFATDVVIADAKEITDKESKHYKSPATIADQQAEHAIKAMITDHFPSHGFLGEEEGGDLQCDYTRIIDPIDGTKAYMRGMDDRSILLALQYQGHVVLGISLMPVIGELVYAVQGGGCWVNYQPAHLSTRSLTDAYIAHERYKYFIREGQEGSIVQLRDSVAYYWANKTPRMFHYLLQGKLEAIVGPSGIYLYDIAPYLIMLQEAGGVFSTLKGDDVCEERTSFVACPSHLHDDIMKFF